MPVAPAVLRAVLDQLAAAGRAVGPDAWEPSVQGAVGHVVGVTGADGPAVLKVVAPALAPRLRSEVVALGLLAGVAGVPTPRVLAHGGADDGHAFLLMTRLPGVRWADRRDVLDAATQTALTSAVGGVLRRLHDVAGPGFGSLGAGAVLRATAWDRVQDRAAELLAEHDRVGGAGEVRARVGALLDAHRAAFVACDRAVLCHRDLVDANLLVSDDDPARPSGVVDLERAAWDDPMADLAQTRVHVRQHVPADADALVDGYGRLTPPEHERLAVHEALHLLAERSWVAWDRPAGWQGSVARLDGLLDAALR